MFVAKRLIDVDRQPAAGGASGQVSQNDVIRAIPVKAGDTVLNAWIEVYTSCTGGASCDVGTGDAVDIFQDGQPLDAQACDGAGTTAPTGGGAHYFHVADTIDVVVKDAAVTAGKFAVCALIVRL